MHKIKRKTLKEIEKTGLDDIESWCWKLFREGFTKIAYDLDLSNGELLVIVSNEEPN